MKTIFVLVGNSGDGSSHLRFLATKAAVDLLTEHNPDTFSDGDGGSFDSFNISEDAEITGIEIETFDTVKQSLLENGCIEQSVFDTLVDPDADVLTAEELPADAATAEAEEHVHTEACEHQQVPASPTPQG